MPTAVQVKVTISPTLTVKLAALEFKVKVVTAAGSGVYKQKDICIMV